MFLRAVDQIGREDRERSMFRNVLDTRARCRRSSGLRYDATCHELRISTRVQLLFVRSRQQTSKNTSIGIVSSRESCTTPTLAVDREDETVARVVSESLVSVRSTCFRQGPVIASTEFSLLVIMRLLRLGDSVAVYK